MRRRATLSIAGALAASLGLAPAALATFPGGNGAIAFVRDGDLWAIDPDGGGEHRITSGPHADAAPDWSPDGTEIAFERRDASGSESHVYVVRADGTGLRWVRRGASPAWSPDGTRLAYLDDGLRIMDRDGTDPKPVLPAIFDEIGAITGPLDWAPGTDLIGHGRSYDAFEDVAATSPGKSALNFTLFHDRPPEAQEVDAEELSWSPDGTRVALRVKASIVHACSPDRVDAACPEDPAIGLTTMTLGGTERRTIVPEGRSPSWSPDGARIAYVTGSFPKPAEVWVAAADGTGKRRLTVGAEPDWQSLPRRTPAELPPAVTVTVPVEVPGPVRIVERVVTRAVRGAPAKCVVPKGKRRFTLVLRAHRTIRAGMGFKVRVLPDRGDRVQVVRGKRMGLRAAIRRSAR